MTECPICQCGEISKDTRLCPLCGTDLNVYKLIEEDEKERKKTKRKLWLSYSISILLFIILVGVVSMLFSKKSVIIPAINANKNPEMQVIIKENDRYKNEIKQLNNKIEEMKKPVIQTEMPASIKTNTITPTSSVTQLPKESEQKNVTSSSAKSGSNFKTHVVKEGETTYGIARMYYGDGAKFIKIVRDNNLKDATFITAGAELKIYDSK